MRESYHFFYVPVFSCFVCAYRELYVLFLGSLFRIVVLFLLRAGLFILPRALPDVTFKRPYLAIRE